MANHWLKERYCRHGSHMAPADGFRWLPGIKIKREVCASCYAKILEARQRIKDMKIGDVNVSKIPF